MWGIAIWFILQRIVTLYLMCRYYKVEPMQKEDVPQFREVLRKGWKAIFLPIIVFLPFYLTNNYMSFFESRLGAGTSAFSNSILLFIPSLIVICGILLSGKETRKKTNVKSVIETVSEGMSSNVKTSALVLFAYFVSNVIADLKVEVAVGEFIGGLNLSLLALAWILPVFTAILGMLIPGSTQVKIFGGIIISIIAGAGGNPLLAAAMLPCICGAMHGVTPPYCACVYVAMGIADSELKPTMINCMIWILLHYILSVLVILELVPLFGLI